MRIIPAGDLAQVLDYPSVMDRIRDYYRSGGIEPDAARFKIDSALGSDSPMLTAAPAWRVGGYIGLRLQTDFQANPSATPPLPRAMATYLLLSGKTGEPLALVDGQELSLRRRAACSALALQFLARPDCERLLMIGASPLGLALTQAFQSVRPICTMLIYSGNVDAAGRFAKRLNGRAFRAEVTTDLQAAVEGAHVICHTGAEAEPDSHIEADWLQLGQHLDYHGGDESQRSILPDGMGPRLKAFVCNASAEQPGLAGSIEGLSQGVGSARNLYTDITAFLNGGSALADLAAAKLAFERA